MIPDKSVNRCDGMKAEEIFARRLRSARVMAGYSMDDLVRKMGNSVSKMTISKQQIHVDVAEGSDHHQNGFFALPGPCPVWNVRHMLTSCYVV